jgi:type IV pilus assembly protein PilC
MLKAGEASGSLSDVLERLIYILEHEHKVKSDIKSACRYPIMVLGMLGLAFLILLTFVVPKFAVMFEEAGIDLPIPTRICMLMYAGLSNFWYLILAALVGVGAFLFISLRTPHGQYVRDQLLMRLPVIGPLFVKSAMSRFSSIFAILQASGVSVLNSIDILCETIGNAAISHEFTRVRSQLVEGKGIAAPLRAARYFTPLVVNMAAIGEESGSLDEMLREVASHYDMEVEYATRKLTDMITPALTLGLAGVVGFFALAIYLPMWDMAKMAQQ